MRFFIKKFVVFSIVIVLIGIPFDYYLTHFHFKDWKNISKFQKDFWLLGQKNKNWDIAVLGTSRAFHMVNPGVIKEMNPNLSMINYGTDGTSHADHYLYLYQLLKNKVKMDTLILEVDEFTLSGWQTNTMSFKGYVFALKVNEEPFKQAFRDYYDRRKYLLYKLPLVRFVEYNNYYQLNPLRVEHEDRFTYRHGFAEAFTTGFRRDFKRDSLELLIHHFDIKYLNMIIELAKENDIEVILFTAPVEEEFKKIEINRARSISKIKEIAKNHNLSYYDFSMVEGIKDTSYFSDETHLNIKGANKFTKHFYNTLHDK